MERNYAATDIEVIRNTTAKLRVAYIGSAIASYRRGFFRRVCLDDTIELTVFCQDRFPSQNLELIHDELNCQVVTVPFLGREDKVVVQWLPLVRLLRDFDVYVMYANPRIISTVIWSFLFRWLGRPIVLLGHAHTAFANPRTERLRHWWWRHFQTILVYNQREVAYLRQRGFTRQSLFAWNNGLDQRAIDAEANAWPPERLRGWQAERGLQQKTVVLSVARLIEKNHFQLFVRALPQLIVEHPQLVWCVIGGGPQQEELEQLALKLGVGTHVRWVGPLYEESSLAPWFLSSRCLIHPGAVGLTMLHAFGYGLPVITNNRFDEQMPEIAAFHEGENGLSFTPGNVAELQDAVRRFLGDPAAAREMGLQGRRLVREEFNTDVMADRFITAVRHAANVGDGLDEV